MVGWGGEQLRLQPFTTLKGLNCLETCLQEPSLQENEVFSMGCCAEDLMS